MKKFTLLFFTVLMTAVFSHQANAQDTPAPSPLGKVYQRVGLTDVEVVYSRPGMKDRKVFGANGIVPFGQLWRTGANAATTISFSKDVRIGGEEVAAGKYAIFSIPGESEWTIILNSDADQRGTGSYSQAKDAVRFLVPVLEYPGPVETMTFVFGNVKDYTADLYMIWENTAIAIPLEVK